MNIAHRFAEAIAYPPDGKRWRFIDGPLHEAFAGIRDDGKVVICWRGENYTKQPTTLRIRLHNWLIRVGERRIESDISR